MNNDKALKLEWVEAPNHISYGTGMMEAIIPMGKDSSLHLYCPVEQIANVASALRALAQTQEPVKDWVASHNAICALLRQAHDALALTSYPMKRTWVGLTDEEITGLHHEIKVRLMGTYQTEDIYRAIEAKLKEKNT